MTSTRFITVALPVAAVIAALALVLPASLAGAYAEFGHAGALAAGAGLAWWVARYYRGGLRRAFLFLAAFLLLYSPVSSTEVVEIVREELGESFLRVLLAYQVLTFGCLLAASTFIVQAMRVRRLQTAGVTVAGVVAIISFVLIVRAWSEVDDLLDDHTEAVLLYLLVRVSDAVVLGLLAPVVILYVQNARARYQESLTFTLVSVGILLSLVLVYAYEAIRSTPLGEIAASEYQQGSLLDALYLFGYLTIAVGLFAHRKHQDWAYERINRLLVEA